MYKLEQPFYFLFFAIIPLLIGLYLLVLWWKKTTQKRFASVELLQKIAPNRSNFKPFLKFVFFLLAIFFLIIALINPKVGTQLKTVKQEGIDIVFALDVSKSMLVEDIAPNRLEKAKQIVSKIINQLGSDRIGIIIYAGNSYPLLPITTDHAAGNMFLQSANPNMVSNQGTAINQALDLAKTYYNNNEQTNKFLVMLSDGEDHQEDTKQVAQSLANQGIKIYTIGVGTEKGGPVPIKINNSLIGYKKNRQGKTVISQKKTDILQEIADIGNGIYIDGNKTEVPVKSISNIISKAKKSEFETKQFSDYKDQFQWPLGIALFCLIVDIFLFERKTKWLKQIDLFNEQAKK
ncbi:MAG: vWA domain-containing protein [Tenacibaculum sp.]